MRWTSWSLLLPRLVVVVGVVVVFPWFEAGWLDVFVYKAPSLLLREFHTKTLHKKGKHDSVGPGHWTLE